MIMKNGRPFPAANIYKNGRLKNKQEMDLERERVKKLDFDALLSECVDSISRNRVEHIKELVGGWSDVDLDKPITEET